MTERFQLRRLDRRLREPFPLVGGNSVRALEQGTDFFETMLDGIRNAKHSVDLLMYLWEADEVGSAFVRALGDAAKRGVSVRVLADDFGSRRILRGGLREILEDGADVRAFSPFALPFGRRFYNRTHKKLLVIDRLAAYTGGAGLSLHFSGVKKRERPWEDRMYEVLGPILQQLIHVFEVDFARWKAVVNSPPPQKPQLEHPEESAGVAVGRVLRGFPDARDYPATLIQAIDAAKDRVWIGTPYFLPPHTLGRSLRDALARGVEVQIVLPSAEGASPVLWYASRRHYGRYLRRGAQIFERGPEFYHAKLAVVDRDTALFGSSNLDWWSWRRNAEIDLLFTDADTVGLVANRFEYDRARSREVTLEEHRKRGFLHRIFEAFFGLFDEWL